MCLRRLGRVGEDVERTAVPKVFDLETPEKKRTVGAKNTITEPRDTGIPEIRNGSPWVAASVALRTRLGFIQCEINTSKVCDRNDVFHKKQT